MWFLLWVGDFRGTMWTSVRVCYLVFAVAALHISVCTSVYTWDTREHLCAIVLFILSIASTVSVAVFPCVSTTMYFIGLL